MRTIDNKSAQGKRNILYFSSEMFSLRHKSCLIHQTQDNNNNDHDKISESEGCSRLVIIRQTVSPPDQPHPGTR